MNPQGLSRPVGDITTLLDLAPRDVQDNEYTPLSADKTWWLPDSARRIRPFSLSCQQFPIRGPTSFGQRFTFDLGSVTACDLLFSTILQIDLGHWLDPTTLLRLESARANYKDRDAWHYANSLGSIILEQATLEIGDQVIEQVDGDFLNVTSLLFQDLNGQFGFSADGLGRQPLSSLTHTPPYRPFPTQNGSIFVPLPFFFQRVKLQEALPLLACREGSIRINITLRPFAECVRRLSGRRLNCVETPLDIDIDIIDRTEDVQLPRTVHTPVAAPTFNKIQLITYGAVVDGEIRQRILRDPFEILTRVCNTFYFAEPLKYATKTYASNIIQVQLPLEVNHPLEEILWFVRRKATANNNEWTNYSSVTGPELDPVFNPPAPLLQNAILQLNGIELINQEEQWFRQHISLAHKGGAAAFNNFIYGYSFAKNPAQHQPSGTANASRLQSIRLTLDVSSPGGEFEQEWEIKVFVISLQWLRFQNGIANKMYQD
jgi:hypothetical protein